MMQTPLDIVLRFITWRRILAALGMAASYRGYRFVSGLLEFLEWAAASEKYVDSCSVGNMKDDFDERRYW